MGVHLAEMIPFDNENCLLGCMAHVINLAAQAGIKAFSSTPPPQTDLPGDLANILHDQPPDVEVKTIISRISGLTSFLKHSPTKAKEFAILAAGMKLNVGLIKDVPTRWNSTYDMLQRASYLQKCISVFCITHEVDDKYGLEPHEWLKLDQLCDFLAPLEDATRTITPEHSTTLGAAAPIYMMLINQLNEALHKYDRQEMIPSAKEMVRKLRGYFDAAVKKPVYLCSTILDPRLKMTVFDRPGFLEMIKVNKETILENFKIEAQRFKSNRYENDQINDEPDPKAHRNTLKSSLFTKKRQQIGSLNDEIDCYLSSETEERPCNPLHYWKSKSEHFPSLANMARTFLAVPASSAPSERAFSAGRHIQDYTRKRLCIGTLEALIRLEDWVDEDVINVGHIETTDA
ncbi:hypothetical protein MJO29_002120 [Puccinia striiformis f. sp. tritici]|nr:hypothetical protein MJO29_002120 [Puccinia striiformis f. sp. tritici]